MEGKEENGECKIYPRKKILSSQEIKGFQSYLRDEECMRGRFQVGRNERNGGE